MEDENLFSDAKNKARVDRLEEITGYTFKDRALALQAVTHPSSVEGDTRLSYERLEFLGDSVVGFSVASECYHRFPDIDEGVLTQMRIAVVNGDFLTAAARAQGLEACIVFGSSERASGSRGHKSALEDVFEALTGALYLDGGFEVARGWVIRNVGEFISPDLAEQAGNPKSRLQEIVQAQGGVVTYRIISTDGPSHCPTFVAEALIDDVPAGQGSGTSKKAAESDAAQSALDALAQKNNAV